MDQPEEDWTASDYWLAHCEGFRVESPGGRVGIVEHVIKGAPREVPEALVVRSGTLGGTLVLVPTEAVRSVGPREQRIVVDASWRPPAGDFLSALRAWLRLRARDGRRA